VLACSRSLDFPNDATATYWAGELTAISAYIVDETQPATSGAGMPVSDPADPTQTPSPTVEPSPIPTETPQPTPDTALHPVEPSNTPLAIPTSAPTGPVILYYSQSGDTLPALSVRFDTPPDTITSPDGLPETGLINPNLLLVIPDTIPEKGPEGLVIPDSEVVFSPSAVDFNIVAEINKTDGYLKTYREYIYNRWHTGAEVVERVAVENSVNPRLLLSLLEYQSHWVSGQPTNLAETDYPIGFVDYRHKGLYRQLSWAVQQLNIGYYGWREGLVTTLEFPETFEGGTVRLAPQLNAGTVAVQLLFSKLYDRARWYGVLYSDEGFPALHENMFGNPWMRANTVEPLYPTSLSQPAMVLPFQIGHTWAFTGGPHSAWGPDGARAALDFAPGSTEHGCVDSAEWVTAVAPGVVVRSGDGVVVVDMDGDGREQTGWSILYLHIKTAGRVENGAVLEAGDRIGHPSCEGGVSTGTHVHIARKYNGEWILAAGPMPFNLSGWVAHAGEAAYLGTLTKEDKTCTANVYGSFETNITREN